MNILYQASFFYLLSETLLAQSYLTDTEFAITLDLVEQLGIREFVYIGNNVIDSRIIPIVKKFSNAKIPSQYLSIWHANAYMYNQKFYSKMAVVFKENAVPYLRDITRLYAQVGKSQRESDRIKNGFSSHYRTTIPI